MAREKKLVNKILSKKEELLVLEYKQKFPILSAEQMADILTIDVHVVDRLYKKGVIIIPSKMNDKKNFIS